jgi:hypothetical protein
MLISVAVTGMHLPARMMNGTSAQRREWATVRIAAYVIAPRSPSSHARARCLAALTVLARGAGR